MLILLQECVRRAFGRPLLPDCTDLLAVPKHLDALPCCVMLLAPAAGPGAGTGTGTSLHLAAGSSADPFPAVSSWQGTEGQSEQDSGLLAGALCVVHLNRAAAEALQPQGVQGAGQQQQQPGGGWRLWLEPSQVEHLRQLMSTCRGQPQRGSMQQLVFRVSAVHASSSSGSAGSGSGSGEGSLMPAGGCGAVDSLSCTALVLPVMSPNGACAGAAVLFDSWEARRHKRPDRQQTQEEVQVQVLEGRPLVPEVLSGWRPSEGQVAELQESVRAQADAIREMKTAQGLKNQDPRVVAAVAQLQTLKTQLELAQRLGAAFGGDSPGVVQQLLASEAMRSA